MPVILHKYRGNVALESSGFLQLNYYLKIKTIKIRNDSLQHKKH